MATWRDLATARPGLADLARSLIGEAGIGYLATVRRDGGPRLHPVCPVIGDGRLFVGVGPTSPKQHDLRRDARCVLHLLPGEDDTEFCIRALAVEITSDEDREVFRAACRDAGVNVEDDGPAFELLIERVDTTVWENCGQPDTRPVRDRWVPTK